MGKHTKSKSGSKSSSKPRKDVRTLGVPDYVLESGDKAARVGSLVDADVAGPSHPPFQSVAGAQALAGAASPSPNVAAGFPSPVRGIQAGDSDVHQTCLLSAMDGTASSSAAFGKTVHPTRLLPPGAGTELRLNSNSSVLGSGAQLPVAAATSATGQTATRPLSPRTYSDHFFPALGQCCPPGGPTISSSIDRHAPAQPGFGSLADSSLSSGVSTPSSGVRPPYQAVASCSKLSPTPLLTHHPVSLDAGSTILIPSHISRFGVASWSCSLVGSFVGDTKSLHFASSWAKRLWGDKVTRVFSYGNGFFIFCFSDPCDLQPIVSLGHAYFGNELIFLQAWQPSLKLTSPRFSSLPLWVKFSNVPLALWHEEGLAYLASHLGKPLFLDDSTRSGTKLAYARVCVDIDVTTSIPTSFNVLVEGCDIHQVHIEVPWRPRQCLFCKIYGHSESKCSSNPQVLPPKPVVQKAKLAWQVVNPQKGSVLGIPSTPSSCTSPPTALPKGCTPKVLPSGSPERLSRALAASPRHPAGSPERLLRAQEDARRLAEGPTGSPEGLSSAPEAPRRQSEGSRRHPDGHDRLPKASRRLPNCSSEAALPLGGSSVAAPSGPLPLREMECCSVGGAEVCSSVPAAPFLETMLSEVPGKPCFPTPMPCPAASGPQSALSIPALKSCLKVSSGRSALRLGDPFPP